MALTNPISFSSPATLSLQVATRRALPFVFLATMFSQPNGLVLYLPIYPQVMLLLLLLFTPLWLSSKLQTSISLWPHISLSRPLMLYMGLSLMSLVWSPDPALGARLLFSTFFKIIVFYVLVDLCGRRETLRWVLQIIIGLSLIFAVQGLALLVAFGVFHIQPSADFSSKFQVEGMDRDFGVISYGIFGLMKVAVNLGGIILPRCQSIFVEPGFYSNFLEMTLFVSVAYFNIQPPRRKWVPGLAYVVQGSALLMTFSPIGLFAVGMGGIVFALFTYQERARQYARYACRAAVGLVVIGAVIQGTIPGGVVKIVDILVISKFVKDNSVGFTSSSERQERLTEGLDLFLKYPLLGCGTSQTRVLAGTAITNNSVLVAAAELGIVGLGLYLSMLTCIGFTIANTYFLAQKCRSPRHKAFAGAASAAALAMVFHSMFIEIQWSYYYWTAIALLYTSNRALHSLYKGRDTLDVMPAN